MDDPGPPMYGTARAAVCMGRHALRVLTSGRGTVLAAFASALYLESEAGIACIAPPSTPCGPLNVVMPGFVRPAAAGPERAAWRADEATLAIDGLGTFMLSPRVDWNPPRPSTVDAAMLHAGLASMQAALAARAPRGEVLPHVLGASPICVSSEDHRSRGFPRALPASWPARCSDGEGPAQLHALETPPAGGIRAMPFDCRGPARFRALGAPAGSGPADARLARSVPALARWIGDALRGKGPPSPRPAVDLLGAGRGLTPSGDDCLAGTLVALHAFGERAARTSLARAVARRARRRTSRLSAAHLEAACGGEAIEPVHEAIRAIAGDTCPGRALDALERFGHGSGFDALAGVLLVARSIAHLRAGG